MIQVRYFFATSLFIHKECTYHSASPSTIVTDKKQFIWAHFQACLFKHQSAQKKLSLGFFSGPTLLRGLLPLLLQLLPCCFQSKHPQLRSTHCPCSALPNNGNPPSFHKKVTTTFSLRHLFCNFSNCLGTDVSYFIVCFHKGASLHFLFS